MIALTTERLPASRRIRRDIAQLRPLIDAGYPLVEIWKEYRRETNLTITYRHFTRTLAEIRRESQSKATPEAGGSSWIGRILSKLSGSA